MKKVLIVLLVLIGLAAGYLVYDWITVSRKRANAPTVDIYSWEDTDGTVHFTDKAPPSNAVKVHRTEGQAYVAPPLAIRMKDKAAEWYTRAKERIFKIKRRRSGTKSLSRDLPTTSNRRFSRTNRSDKPSGSTARSKK